MCVSESISLKITVAYTGISDFGIVQHYNSKRNSLSIIQSNLEKKRLIIYVCV